jgi:transposase
MTEAYDGRQVVGMDLHRRRSVLVRMTEDGRKLETVRIENSPAALRAVLARAGKNPRVVVEATYGWYWAADVLATAGAEVHLAHPLGVKAFSYRRVKNDERDCADLADLLRLGRLPEAQLAPPPVRALREVTRYRHKLVQQRTSCKDQVHAVLAKSGIPVTRSDIFGPGGGIWLDGLPLPQPYAGKVASLRALIAMLDLKVARLEEQAAAALDGDPGYAAIRQLPGTGPVPGAVIAAETGDVTRFRKPGQLCSWAGLTPRHHESGLKVIRGHVSKQGSRMLRWAVAEAIQRQPAGTRPREVKDAIIARRGAQARSIAKTAAARILLTQVSCGLRDGHIRRVTSQAA